DGASSPRINHALSGAWRRLGETLQTAPRGDVSAFEDVKKLGVISLRPRIVHRMIATTTSATSQPPCVYLLGELGTTRDRAGARTSRWNFGAPPRLPPAGYEGRKRRAGSTPPSAHCSPAEVIEHLVPLYTAMGKQDRAA